MSAFRAILILLCAAMTASLNNSLTAPEARPLLERIDPWKVVNTNQTVYLTKVTMGNSVRASNYCVSSEYLWSDTHNKTAYRTLSASYADQSFTFSRYCDYSDKLSMSTGLVLQCQRETKISLCYH
uniref:Hypothetical secreted protein 1496 n=1 Tax=Amblyomma variegatum TaxID=34610 RepID=F0J9W3_AMBVA|nr:TPA_inf: hypothetical secreted protein 1496 [Amblyomma variegatum]